MFLISKSLAMLRPSIRISFGLVLITISLLLVADLIGITHNQTKYELEYRKQISESMAILFSSMADEHNIKKLRTVLSKIVIREKELLSAGFRMNSGDLLFEVGQHAELWSDYKDSKSRSTHVLVPIFLDKRKLGSVELRFSELLSLQGRSFFTNPTYKLILFILAFGFLAYFLFILRILRQIDPSAVIPERVNAAFDTLSEGLVILDEKEKIVLANKAFSEILQQDSTKLLGLEFSKLNWEMGAEEVGEVLYPWYIALSSGKSSVGDIMLLKVTDNCMRTMTINCSLIQDGQGNQQGVLVTFDDVTEIEKQKQQLEVVVLDLELSKKDIERQNNELHFLATRDPMTACLNRRSFNEMFAESFNHARNEAHELTCIMVDIDHFKLVNDNYGHGVGDEVIKLLAKILLSSTREEDIVSRYGGEEFCIVLPGIEISEAISIAERMRLRIKKESVNSFELGPHITVSLGVASILDDAKDPAELNDQADQALYVAKESGRNRVVCWAAKEQVESLPSEIDDNSEEGKHSLLRIEAEHIEEVKLLQFQIEQLKNSVPNVYEKNYDKQTGLPNQGVFYDRLNQSIKRASRNNQLTAVLIIDFDLFSQANNSYGLDVAEKMFSLLAVKISSIFRKTDTVSIIKFDNNDVTISRFEGGVYGILLSDLDDHMKVTWTVNRVFDQLSQAVVFEDKEVNVTCNIGISIFPEDASSVEDLISHANTAKSFENKSFTNNSFQFYNVSMQEKSLKLLGLEVEIKRAIKDEEWILYYQPKVDISTDTIVGMEALIRWNHPERGILSPCEFIGLAETRGLIAEIGKWVLRAACKQAKIWLDSGVETKIAINLSAVELHNTKLSNQILSIIHESQIKPQLIELEVTETMVINNLEMAVRTLDNLRRNGVNILIDDFGTGYSSLEYLKRLPIDVLKIDRIFIKDIMTDDFDKSIVKTIISMAHSLGLKVVVEGVETLEQYTVVKQMSCDEVQGYLLSKPVNAECATSLLEQKIILKC